MNGIARKVVVATLQPFIVVVVGGGGGGGLLANPFVRGRRFGRSTNGSSLKSLKRKRLVRLVTLVGFMLRAIVEAWKAIATVKSSPFGTCRLCAHHGWIRRRWLGFGFHGCHWRMHGGCCCARRRRRKLIVDHLLSMVVQAERNAQYR